MSLTLDILFSKKDKMIKLRTETEIMSAWRSAGKPLVSVVCTTYNHEKYIEDAIRGFLIQESDFPFEVIIHDDASTDSTASIAREYAQKYPNIIKPIFQTENQYSQGKKCIIIAFSYTTGEYIALCEGDDYWTDSKKLQTQIDKMKMYPGCSISFHPCLRGYVKEGNNYSKVIVSKKHANNIKIFSPDELIIGGGTFCPTPSLIMKNKIFKMIPAWFSTVPVGDYFIQILGSLGGGALYLPDVMCFHRKNAPGSWGQRVSNNPAYRANLLSARLNSLSAFNLDTSGKYLKAINFAITKRILEFLASRDVPRLIKLEFIESILSKKNGILTDKLGKFLQILQRNSRIIQIMPYLYIGLMHRVICKIMRQE